MGIKNEEAPHCETYRDPSFIKSLDALVDRDICTFIPSQEQEYTWQSSKLPPYVMNHYGRLGIQSTVILIFSMFVYKKNFADYIYPGSYSAPLFCTLALLH